MLIGGRNVLPQAALLTRRQHQFKSRIPLNGNDRDDGTVRRNPRSEEDDFSLRDVVVLNTDVQDEIEPGTWRASLLADSKFEPIDMQMLQALTNWLLAPSHGCARLKMMGGPRRSGGGVTAEQPVCLDAPLAGGAGRTPCLAYSLGVGADWTFVEQLAQQGCEVHVLDHRTEVEPEGQHSFGVFFHRFGVGRNKHRTAEGGEVLTLDGAMARLGHRRRTLRYLCADLDGLETDMLLDQLVDRKSSFDRKFVLNRVEQIALRVHLRSHVERELPFYRNLWRACQQLERLGYELVRSAPVEVGGRWKFPGQPEPIHLMYDVLLVRKRPAVRGFDPNVA
ncbi:uncharacterized protein LOC119112380 [Pollicipes pollicipes]|uniref:uncharacterized protein LOC119112380 n=1 Tax=Pollicipes pollicipes TaxID=41117 RepID=UPI00188567D1|nr:uncharacterized protein LOC119112380 [Pollicipes pollicipes]